MSDSPRWLSTIEAATLLGVSPKTVWRRARAGKLTARKVTGERGATVWEIAADASGQPTGQTNRPTGQTNRPTGQTNRPTGQTNRPTGQKQAANQPANRPQFPENEREASGQTNRTPTGQPAKATGQSDAVAAGERLVESRDEIKFLRGVIEQLQRDGAETRAALREALKSRPKELEAGAVPAPQRDEKRATVKDSPKGASAPDEPAGASESGLSYGDVADWLDELLESRNS